VSDTALDAGSGTAAGGATRQRPGATPTIVEMQVIPVAGGHKLIIDSAMHIAATLTATTTEQTRESHR
jgi:hypothetical protein